MNNNANLFALLGQKAANNLNKTTESKDNSTLQAQNETVIEETKSLDTNESTESTNNTSTEENNSENNKSLNPNDMLNNLMALRQNSNQNRNKKANDANKKNKEKEVVIYKHKTETDTPIYFSNEIVGYLPAEADIPDANIFKYIREHCINHLPQATMPEFKITPGNKCEAYYLVPNSDFDDISNPKKIQKNG